MSWEVPFAILCWLLVIAVAARMCKEAWPHAEPVVDRVQNRAERWWAERGKMPCHDRGCTAKASWANSASTGLATYWCDEHKDEVNRLVMALGHHRFHRLRWADQDRAAESA